jgi:hypothetical protein
MNKYFILCITTNALVGFTTGYVGAFDPALTYKMDDRRPLPSYIYEGEVVPEEEDEGVKSSGGLNVVDDIWRLLDKKQQATKKPKKPK